MIQLADHRKLNNKEDQSMDLLIPFTKGNKTIMGGRERRDLVEKEREKKKGWKIQAL